MADADDTLFIERLPTIESAHGLVFVTIAGQRYGLTRHASVGLMMGLQQTLSDTSAGVTRSAEILPLTAAR